MCSRTTTRFIGKSQTQPPGFESKSLNFVLQSITLPSKVIPMQHNEAEEHLRVIRSLMEKATIYRAISAPTALVGGSLALAAGIGLFAAGKSDTCGTIAFYGTWLTVFILTCFANGLFIWRDAKRRGDAFISSGMKMALMALLPSHLTAGVISAVTVCLSFAFFDPFVILPLIWIVLHGIGLLATTHFAPRSLICLGWTFLIFGLATFVVITIGYDIQRLLQLNNLQFGNLLMAVTFGGFHLLYAALTWPRGAAKANA